MELPLLAHPVAATSQIFDGKGHFAVEGSMLTLRNQIIGLWCVRGEQEQHEQLDLDRRG